jgi:hypothetical protein
MSRTEGLRAAAQPIADVPVCIVISAAAASTDADTHARWGGGEWSFGDQSDRHFVSVLAFEVT